MHQPDRELAYCRRILPRVSRTFALGIELLGEPLRDITTVAYLICRILDTVEDTTSLPPGAGSLPAGRHRLEGLSPVSPAG